MYIFLYFAGLGAKRRYYDTDAYTHQRMTALVEDQPLEDHEYLIYVAM